MIERNQSAKHMEPRTVVGVDGCKAGWFAIVLTDGQEPAYSVEGTFSELLRRYHDAALVLVDIPIGLPEGRDERECDKAARKCLGKPRSSSVFRVPCRQALDAADPSAENCTATGRKLTRQALGIVPKIREVDAVLRQRLDRLPAVREIHPEISFWALNGGQAMRHGKKSRDGGAEREVVLSRVYPGSRQVLEELLAARLRGVARNDTLDALAAALTARGELRTLPDAPPLDSKGLRMEMVYSDGRPSARISKSRSDDWRDTELAKGFTIRDYEAAKACEDRGAIADAVVRRFTERYLESMFRSGPRPHGFTIMAICCLMIETLESFRLGWTDTRDRSARTFRSFFGAHEAFGALRDHAADFYGDVRCGILHQAETRGGWRIRRDGALFEQTASGRTINATEFAERLRDVLGTYGRELKAASWDAGVWDKLRTKMDAICSNCAPTASKGTAGRIRRYSPGGTGAARRGGQI